MNKSWKICTKQMGSCGEILWEKKLIHMPWNSEAKVVDYVLIATRNKLPNARLDVENAIAEEDVAMFPFPW